MISLAFDIFKVPEFGIPSLDASYILSMGIFIVTVFLAYLRQAFFICLSLPIFNMAKSTPGCVERLIMRVFSLNVQTGGRQMLKKFNKLVLLYFIKQVLNCFGVAALLQSLSLKLQTVSSVQVRLRQKQEVSHGRNVTIRIEASSQRPQPNRELMCYQSCPIT